MAPVGHLVAGGGLSLNAAVRKAKYDTDGATAGLVGGGSNSTDITTWKLATVWDVNEC